MRSFRPHGWLMRSVALITGLFTVWCLGCTAFEPLLGCDDDGSTMQDGATMAGTVAAATAGPTADQPDVPPGDCACGCLSCHGATPPVSDVTIVVADAEVLCFRCSDPQVDYATRPLVPPPQSIL